MINCKGISNRGENRTVCTPAKSVLTLANFSQGMRNFHKVKIKNNIKKICTACKIHCKNLPCEIALWIHWTILKGTVRKPKRPANPSATLRHPTWGCIISTRGPRYLIIWHLFILLYLHIILVEIVPCSDALYYGIWCITWSYFILYFLRLIYRHHFLFYLVFFYFLFSWLFCFC